jgi:hypothetical protein
LSLGLGGRAALAAEPADWVIEPCFDDALPDYDTEPDLACANE